MADGAELILSKSAIERFLACGYAYLLSYVHRLPAAPNLDMAVGTGTHAGAEAHWKGQDPLEATESALAREMALGPSLPENEAATARADALAMTRLYLDKIAPTFNPDLIEQPFLIRVDGVLVSGILDAADTVLDEVHDTKTTTTPSKVTPDKHRLGMTAYRFGYRALTGRLPKRLVLDVLGRNLRWKIVDVEPDDQEFTDVVGLVADGINAGRFEPTGALNGSCKWCSYATQCRYVNLD